MKQQNDVVNDDSSPNGDGSLPKKHAEDVDLDQVKEVDGPSGPEPTRYLFIYLSIYRYIYIYIYIMNG